MLENESLFLHFRPTVDDGEPKLLGHSDHIERERDRQRLRQRETETETERERERVQENY